MGILDGRRTHMKLYLIVAQSLGIMGHWDMKPISIYADKDAAEWEVAQLNYMYNDNFSIKEMELK
jgi:hypothetical protein